MPTTSTVEVRERTEEPVVQKVESELESLAAESVTDPVRIAQAVRRTDRKSVV